VFSIFCAFIESSTVFLQAAKMAGWLPDPSEKKFPKTSHVGFGLVLGSDGKRFRTRSTEVVRLVEQLDEAKSRSKSELQQRLTENGKLDYFWNLIVILQVNMIIIFVQAKLLTGRMRN